LIRYGLARAVQIHTDDLRARHAHLKIDLDLVDDEYLLPQETSLALFQVFHAALEQAARQSAQMVTVRYYPLEQQMVLEIRADGEPLFAIHRLEKQAALEEQLRSVGGEMVITYQAGEGSKVLAIVPIKRS
jgi:signal transduction histidine kinase